MATGDTDGHGDRFWAAALACGAAKSDPMAYGCHRINNHGNVDPRHRCTGRSRARTVSTRSLPGAL